MPAKHALIVGVDQYSNLEQQYQLSGCVNDAKLVKRVLTGHFDFDESEISELHNAAASQAGILKEMERLAETIGDDDTVYFHFSGHGSRRTSADPEEVSGMDSTIMPSDSGRDPLPNLDIVDDEIREWLDRLSEKTRSITMTFDCCHSGTITRAPFGVKVRAVEADTRSLVDMGVATTSKSPHRGGLAAERGASGLIAGSEAYVVMSGCLDEEYSYEFEYEDNGTMMKNGALTFFLTNALLEAEAGATYREVFEVARQGVTEKFPHQHPQIEGAGERGLFSAEGTDNLTPSE